MLLSVGCGSEKGGGIPVDLSASSGDCVNYSDFVDSISYIQLHGMGGKPIAEISNIRFADSVIVAFDENSQRVMMFDGRGKYLRDIGARGNGHGEYIRCLQIDLDREKRNVLLYDIVKGSVLKYGYDGGFLGQDSLGRADDIAYLGSGNYLLANYNEERADRSGIYHVSVSPYSIKKLRECRDKIAMNKPFEIFDSDNTPCIMTRSYDDEVLEWHGDSLVSLVNFEIAQNPTDSQKEEIARNPSKRLEYVNRTTFYSYKDLLMIYFSYFKSHEESPGYLLYDKNTRTAKMVKGFDNDIDGTYGMWLPLSVDNSIVSVVDPDDGSDPKIQFLHLKSPAPVM